MMFLWDLKSSSLFKIVCYIVLCCEWVYSRHVSVDMREFQENVATRKVLDGHLWPNGTIPFTIDINSFGTSQSKAVYIIQEAIQEWETRTCIRFYYLTDPSTAESQAILDYLNIHSFVTFTNGEHCASLIGHYLIIGGTQLVQLNSRNCLTFRTVVHEIGHVVGFYHEQNRKDRDKSIMINWENIPADMVINFQKVNTLNLNPYDYQSCMQYGPRAGSSNGKSTMEGPDVFLTSLMGSGTSLSFYDSSSVNMAYGAADDCSQEVHCENDGYPNERCECVCPDFLQGNCSSIATEWNQGGCDPDIRVLGEQETYKIMEHTGRTTNRCAWFLKSYPGTVMQVSVNLAGLVSGRFVLDCDQYIEVRYNLIAQRGKRLCQTTAIGSPHQFTTHHNELVILLNARAPPQSLGGSVVVTIISGPSESSLCVPNPCPTVNTVCLADSTSNSYSCPCRQNLLGENCDTVAEMFCDFEGESEDIFPECFLIQSEDDDLDWRKRMANSVSSQHFGTSGHHSSFLFIEGTNGNTGELATLKSLTIKGMIRCVELHYLIDGGLDLTVTFMTGTRRNSRSVSSSPLRGWQNVKYTVYSVTHFKLLISGRIRSDHQSTIALDSISLTEGVCSGQTDHVLLDSCSNEFCLVGENIRCTFDTANDGSNGWCVFENATNTNFNWTRSQGPTPTTNTGPVCDVSGNGYYLYTEASWRKPGWVAIIQTPFFEAGQFCICVMVHMYGPDIGGLTMLLRDNQGHQKRLSAVGSHGDLWRQAEIQLTSEYPYQVLFEGKRGAGYRSDMAIDNFSITRGECAGSAQRLYLPPSSPDTRAQLL